MLSRAFVKPRRSPGQHAAAETSLRSASIFEYEDFLFGFMDDIPLVSFSEYNGSSNKAAVAGSYMSSTRVSNDSESAQITLRQVLRASVGVMGESPLGMTEKVVLLGGKICAVKRFRRVVLRKSEFGRRIEKIAEVGNQCEYLVPVAAYLFAKRIKFVVSDYYPMGTLADLLSGAKEQGHTALEWKLRFRIVLSIAKAIEFIHSQNPPREKHLKLNVHGNIKSSNVMINIDFSARLSDYGFVQLAVVEDTGQLAEGLPPRAYAEEALSQEGDVYDFGSVLMDILEWPEEAAAGVKTCDFSVDGEEERQAAKVLEVAVNCRNRSPEARPSIGQILCCLGDTVKWYT